MTIYLTPGGKKQLEKELKELMDKRPLMAQRIERAKEMGDLKENAEYHDAKDEQGMMESRIREIQSTLTQSQVVEKNTASGKISLGSKIKIFVNGMEKSYEIVGINEAAPLTGKISSESPLGKSFLGHKEGDDITAVVPAGKIIYKIIKVE